MCSCSAPRPYQLTVGGKDCIVYGLDQIIFSTILAFPTDEESAWEKLWEGLRLFNPAVNLTEKSAYKAALLQLYNEVKKEYEIFEAQSNPDDKSNQHQSRKE